MSHEFVARLNYPGIKLFLYTHRSQVILEILHGLTDVYEKELGQKRIHTHCDTLHDSGHSKKALLSIDRQFHLCSFSLYSV